MTEVDRRTLCQLESADIWRFNMNRNFHLALRDSARIHQTASADAGVLDIPDSASVPESTDGRYRLSRVNENGEPAHFQRPSQQVSVPAAFRQNVRLPVPIITRLAPAAH
jgi:hypothetical protein